MRSVTIPQHSIDFLERVGLPTVHDTRFRFEPSEVPLPEVNATQGYRRVGLYDSSSIVVKEPDGGVYWYDEDGPAARFMNSAIESFAVCLTTYHQMLATARTLVGQQRKPEVAEAERQMKIVDPQAFASDDLYWPIVFEEIGYELD